MLNPWYVTGFCDGEAAFTYSRAGGSYALYFAVKQRADNAQIVEDIRAYFNYIGNIYQGKESRNKEKPGFTRLYAYYRVTKIAELENVIKHFDAYPLQSRKKHVAYKAWREMVAYKTENYRNIDYDKLHNLAEKLSSLNLQSRAFKVHKS